MKYLLKEANVAIENIKQNISDIIEDVIGDYSICEYLEEMGCRRLKPEQVHSYQKMIDQLSLDIDIHRLTITEDETNFEFPISYIVNGDKLAAVYIGVTKDNIIGSLCIYSVVDSAVGKVSEVIIDNEEETVIDILDTSIIEPSSIEESFQLIKGSRTISNDIMRGILNEEYSSMDLGIDIDDEELLDLTDDLELEDEDILYTEQMVPVFINSKKEYLIEYQDIARLMNTYNSLGEECTEYMALQRICNENSINMDDVYVVIESTNNLIQKLAEIRRKIVLEKDPIKKQKFRLDLLKCEDNLKKLKKNMNIKIKKKKRK